MLPEELLLNSACLTLDLDSVDVTLEITGVGGGASCQYAICLQPQLGDARNLDALLCICSRDECSQHGEKDIGYFSDIHNILQSIDDFSICFDVKLQPGGLADMREPRSAVCRQKSKAANVFVISRPS